MKKGLFSAEADLVVLQAMNWLGDRQHYRLPAVAPYIRPTGKRHFSEADKKAMRAMAKTAVWAEVGGRAAGHAEQNERLAQRLGFTKSQRQINEEGNGRTHWVGMPEWAQGFGMNRDEITAAVEKAIAGERLGSKQRDLLQSMIDAIYEQRAI